MFDYTKFAANPTRYGGVQFRSRLEATWAALFDLLQWNWEYEPFDLNGWVPDFLIYGKKVSALAEMKPIILNPWGVQCTEVKTVADKISAASPGDYHLLLCGVSPTIDYTYTDANCTTIAPLGAHVYSKMRVLRYRPLPLAE